MLRNGKSYTLTAGLFLHKLPLTVDDTEDEQGQKDRGQGTADDGRQGCVPRAGGRGRDLHEVDLAGTWKPQEWGQQALNHPRDSDAYPQLGGHLYYLSKTPEDKKRYFKKAQCSLLLDFFNTTPSPAPQNVWVSHASFPTTKTVCGHTTFTTLCCQNVLLRPVRPELSASWNPSIFSLSQCLTFLWHIVGMSYLLFNWNEITYIFKHTELRDAGWGGNFREK